MAKGRKIRWSRSFGRRKKGKVRIFTEPNSPYIYGTVNDGKHKPLTKSLGHADKELAIKWAEEQLGKLLLGMKVIQEQRPTTARVWSLYIQHECPKMSRGEQTATKTDAKLFVSVLGGDLDLTTLAPYDWNRIADLRTSGTVAGDGTPVPEERRVGVKPSTAAHALARLRTVCRWAKGFRDENGQRLMTVDPTEGLKLPSDPNIARPVATSDRFRRLRLFSDSVMMRVYSGGKKLVVRSFLSELLDLSFHTGRRISSICALRFADLQLNQGPHGSISWSASTDKMGKSWLVPINEAARAALNRVLAERPGIGQTLLFPSPQDPSRPISKDLASSWLAECERAAGLEHLLQGGFHAFRRGWATSRKHLPIQDVMAVGGWSDPTCLATIYMQADVSTMVRVATEAAEIREVRQG